MFFGSRFRLNTVILIGNVEHVLLLACVLKINITFLYREPRKQPEHELNVH